MKARALPVIDTLDLEGQRLVLVGERVVLLSPVASVVHRLLGEVPVSLPDLLTQIAQELPLPADPQRALRAVLDQLSAEDLVALEP